jgi:hypothetical protein
MSLASETAMTSRGEHAWRTIAGMLIVGAVLIAALIVVL